MLRLRRVSLLLALCAALGACGENDGGTLDIALVGVPADLQPAGVRLSPAARAIRGATVDGLVGFDAQGRVGPAMAERWIITDDGRSYIFRLRDGKWPDGSDLTGESVEAALRRTIRGLKGTAMGYDLRQIDEVRAMAGRVVEIRLTSPMPDFLQLLAQPELGLFRNGKGLGLMRITRRENVDVMDAVAPGERGLPQEEGWKLHIRELNLRVLPIRKAIALFDEGEVDVVLGGRIQDMPLAETGPLSRGTVRMDPVIGLFGLQVMRGEGFLADPSRREALAMAVDREALIAPFNVDGWQATTRIVAPGLREDLGTIGERWSDLGIEARQAQAARRVAAWRASDGADKVQLTIALPDGPGADLVYDRLKADFAAIGITLRRVPSGKEADLVLFEALARYASPLWFLNQFNCGLKRGLCSAEADARVKEAIDAPDTAAGAALLAEAEAELTQANVFVPLGPPLRWSLVRGSITGFEPNAWGVHPLPALALIPN